jgi:hypothetical protein
LNEFALTYFVKDKVNSYNKKRNFENNYRYGANGGWEIALFCLCLWVGFVCRQAKANVCNVRWLGILFFCAVGVF